MLFLRNVFLWLLLSVAPALADSTINPTQPAANAPLASAPVRNNFLAAYNDVRSILGMYRATSAPVSPIKGQFWLDSTTTPSEVVKQYDGAQWVSWGILNTSTHTFVTTGTAAAGTTGSVQVNASGVLGSSTSFTWSSPALTLGLAGSTTGQLKLTGSGSGTITIQGQTAAGTYNFNLPITAGTSAQVLASGGGVAAPMTWTTLAASATTDTTNATNITSGSLAIARLAAVAGPTIISNITGGSAAPAANTVTAVLDTIGATQGQVLYRNATSWVVLAVGSAGQALVSGGAAANVAWQTLSGTGTVTSVALTMPSIFSVGGSPITTTGTLAVTANGTSGGVPYFDSATTLASSAALTANRIVVGGGAGAAPTVLASLGTTTTVLHGNAGGAPTFGAVSLTADVSGTLPVGNGGTGVANPTAHALLVGNGSSAVTPVGPDSTTGKCLVSQGSSADPSYGSGCQVLLNTLTASSSATLSDTTSLTATYSSYLIVFINILPASNNVTLTLLAHTGGTFPATSYITTTSAAVTAGTNVTNITTGIALVNASSVSSTGTGFSGYIRVFNPSQTTAPKMWVGAGGNQNGSGGTTLSLNSYGGYWNGGNGAVDGFQISASAGNLASGVVKIYGIQ